MRRRSSSPSLFDLIVGLLSRNVMASLIRRRLVVHGVSGHYAHTKIRFAPEAMMEDGESWAVEVFLKPLV